MKENRLDKSLLDELRLLLVTAGLTDKEAESVTYAIVAEAVQIAENHHHRIPPGPSLSESAKTVPMIAKAISESHGRDIWKDDGRKQGRKITLTDLLIGVMGNAAFFGVCKAVEYLSAHGWILHCPSPLVSHVESILDMPNDGEFFSRLPPEHQELEEKYASHGAIVSLSRHRNSYVAKVVLGGLGDASRLSKTLTDNDLKRLVEKVAAYARKARIRNVGLYYLGEADNFYTPWWNND